jgi:hypothetical protein
MGWDGPLGAENRWVSRRETIGRGINTSVIAVCPVPSPFDSKGRCIWVLGGGGWVSVGEDIFFTLRNGAFRLL